MRESAERPISSRMGSAIGELKTRTRPAKAHDDMRSASRAKAQKCAMNHLIRPRGSFSTLASGEINSMNDRRATNPTRQNASTLLVVCIASRI